MKKILTILVILIICTLGTFLLTGCENKNENNITNEKQETNEVTNENNIIDTHESTQEGNYEVISKNNKVEVINTTSAYVITTTYNFKNNKINSIIITQKFSTNEIAKASYDSLKSDENVTEIYSDIKLDRKSVILTSTKKLVDMLGDITQEELYNSQKATYEYIKQ